SVKLAGIYAGARLLSWTDQAIELGASGLLVSDVENIKELKKIVAEVLGAPLDVRVKPVAGAFEQPRSVMELEAQRAEAMRERREQEARAHPVTEKVIETFGAAIKEIKVDG